MTRYDSLAQVLPSVDSCPLLFKHYSLSHWFQDGGCGLCGRRRMWLRASDAFVLRSSLWSTVIRVIIVNVYVYGERSVTVKSLTQNCNHCIYLWVRNDEKRIFIISFSIRKC